MTTITACRRPEHSLLLTAFWSLLVLIISTLGAAAATFTVTNTNDSEAGSLRQAIADAQAAAGANTIVFSSLFNSAQTIQLASSLPDYNSADPLTITGPGSNLLTIRGNDTFRIFTLTTNSMVTLSGLTITNGRDTFYGGGGIYKQFGTLSITNVVVTANTANSGGGIQLFNGATLNAVNSTISNNAAINGEGGGISGIQSSLINLTNTTVSGNTATGLGAGVRAADGATAVINGSTFSNNATTGGAGGGVSSSTSLQVTSTILTGNSAYNGGGAISSTGTATVTNCMISNNSSARGDTFGGAGGGGIASGGVALSITGSIITGNTSARVGGGIVSGANGATTTNITDSTISNNTVTSIEGSSGGGGILLGLNDTSMITRTTISGNSLVAVNDGNHGGGIEAFGNLNLIDSVVTGNSSPNDGGGIYISADAAVSISGSRIYDNTANSDQMGEGAGVSGNGGGICAKLGAGNTSGIMTITATTLNDNRTLSGGPNEKVGGGIYTQKQMNMTNCTVSGNSAVAGSGIYIVYLGITNDMINVINSTIANNTATGEGGGLLFIKTFDDGAIVNLRNSLIANNTASTNPDLDGTFNSQGYNLIGNITGANITGDAATNVTGVDPKLGPLQDNGGMTLTHALLADSPAIDKGKSADVMTDQRGLPRPYNYPSIPNATGGDGSDIGAFEDQPPNTVPGDDVTVEAPAGDASVTFKSITQAGFTTFAEIVPPSSAGTPPAGYTIVDDAPAYDINTTAIYTAPITVCFTVDSITDEAEFARVRILHGENGVLVDRTDLDSLVFASRTVCAQVDSLSPFVVALEPAPGLLNISTRLQVLTGDQVLIGGFIVTGTDPKMVILRAIGPSLGASGISDPLADPVLELRAQDGSTIMSNDNWTEQQDEIEATGLAPTDDLESAIVATLDPGAYTAIMSGKDGGTGVGLVEVYDLDQSADSELANISTRGFVDTGDNVMIGGFILGSESDVVVRAIGPSLTAFGVPDALEDPTLELRDVQGTLVNSNDNWKDSQQAAIEDAGLAPQDDLESAILETLLPGAYTAIVAGQSGGTGVGLVEVYRLP